MPGDSAHLPSSSVFFPIQVDFSGGRPRTIIDWRGIPLATLYGFEEIGGGHRLAIAKRWKEGSDHFLKLVHPAKGTTIDYAVRCLFNPLRPSDGGGKDCWAFLEIAPGLASVGRTITPWTIVQKVDKDTVLTLSMDVLRTEASFIRRIVEERLSAPSEAIVATFGDMMSWSNPDWGEEGNMHRVCIACLAPLGVSTNCARCGNGRTVGPTRPLGDAEKKIVNSPAGDQRGGATGALRTARTATSIARPSDRGQGTVFLNPFGRAIVSQIAHSGRNHVVLQATLGSREVAIKIPRPGHNPETLARSSLWTGSETFFCTEVGTSTRRPDHNGEAAMEQLALLMSEHYTLKSYGAEWNSDAIGVATYSEATGRQPFVQGLDTLLWPCLVLPYYEGRALASFPPGERLDLFRRMLPALWEALSGRLHGDLTPDNLMIDPSGALFRILDPAPVAARLAEGSAHEDGCVSFATTPAYYPLIAPFTGFQDVAWMRATLMDGASPVAQKGFPQRGYWPLADVFADERALFRQTPLRHHSAAPFAADQQALGILLFRLATGRALFIPELIDEPAWATTGITCNRGFSFPAKRYEIVRAAMAQGYLDRQLETIADKGLAALIRQLVRCEVQSAGELVSQQ